MADKTLDFWSTLENCKACWVPVQPLPNIIILGSLKNKYHYVHYQDEDRVSEKLNYLP